MPESKISTATRPALPITVRMTLESMRTDIVHSWTGFEEDLKAAIDEAITDLITTLDLKVEVRRILAPKIREALDRQIQYAVADVVSELKLGEALRSLIKKALKETVLND